MSSVFIIVPGVYPGDTVIRKADMNVGSSVSRISLTRPQLAGQVEDLLVRMGQQGQVRGKVADEALKGLLEQVNIHYKVGFKADLV